MAPPLLHCYFSLSVHIGPLKEFPKISWQRKKRPSPDYRMALLTILALPKSGLPHSLGHPCRILMKKTSPSGQNLRQFTWVKDKFLEGEISRHVILHSWALYPREMKTHVYSKTCAQRLITALLTTAKKRKQPKHASNEQINKIYIYTIAYRLAIKIRKY